MMKNKKGFTLVELLAVIVVLAIIMSIAGSAVMRQRKTANVEEAKKMEHDIETIGYEAYIGKETGKVFLVDLTKYGLKSSSIKNPAGSNNPNCEGYVEIKSGPEITGHICCVGVYETNAATVPTDCDSYKKR